MLDSFTGDHGIESFIAKRKHLDVTHFPQDAKQALFQCRGPALFHRRGSEVSRDYLGRSMRLLREPATELAATATNLEYSLALQIAFRI